MNKRWITLILSVYFVIILSGCGSKATTSDESERNKIIYGSVVEAYLKTIHDIAICDPSKRNDVIKRDFPNSIHKDSLLLNFWSDRANSLLNYVTGVELIEVKSIIQKGDNNIEVATKEKWQIKGKNIIVEPIYTFTKQSINWRIYEVQADNLYKILTDSYSENIQKTTAGKVSAAAQKTSSSNSQSMLSDSSEFANDEWTVVGKDGEGVMLVNNKSIMVMKNNPNNIAFVNAYVWNNVQPKGIKAAKFVVQATRDGYPIKTHTSAVNFLDAKYESLGVVPGDKDKWDIINDPLMIKVVEYCRSKVN